MKTLRERITFAKEKAGISQADLARLCGIKPPSVHGWFSGKTAALKGETLLKAAKALNVRAEWLESGKLPVTQKEQTELSITENAQATDLADEFAAVYKLANEEGKAFMRTSLNIARIQYGSKSPVKKQSS